MEKTKNSRIRVLSRQDIVFTKKASSFVKSHASQPPKETPKFKCESAEEVYFVMNKSKSFKSSSPSVDEKSPGSVSNLPRNDSNFEIKGFNENLVSPQFQCLQDNEKSSKLDVWPEPLSRKHADTPKLGDVKTRFSGLFQQTPQQAQSQLGSLKPKALKRVFTEQQRPEEYTATVQLTNRTSESTDSRSSSNRKMKLLKTEPIV